MPKVLIEMATHLLPTSGRSYSLSFRRKRRIILRRGQKQTIVGRRWRPSAFKTVRTKSNTSLASKLLSIGARSLMCRNRKRPRKS